MDNTNSRFAEKDPLLLKIDDKWVNLQAWAKVHPGGAQSIERFRGQDATEAFYSLHSKEARNMVKKMKNIEPSNEMSNGLIAPTKAAIAFREFRSQLEKDGWFERNWFWDFFYVASITILAVSGSLISYEHPWIATVLIAFAMQQAGWIGHDYVHGRGKISEILGDGVGGLFNGFSSRWWSGKHNKHHVHTNQFGVDDDIQNDPILHLWVPEPEKDHSMRAYQHVYYHLVYSFLYFSWRIQSFQTAWASGSKKELALMFINYTWLLCLPINVAFFSILLAGFLVAEVVTATHQSEEIIDGMSFAFVDDQFRTTRDVSIDSIFMNWVWGGMQYQLEHHLFPTMPKYRYASLKPLVKDFAEKNGLVFRDAGMFEIMNMNYETMKKFAITKSQKKSS